MKMAEARTLTEPRVCKVIDEIDNGSWEAAFRTWLEFLLINLT